MISKEHYKFYSEYLSLKDLGYAVLLSIILLVSYYSALLIDSLAHVDVSSIFTMISTVIPLILTVPLIALPT